MLSVAHIQKVLLLHVLVMFYMSVIRFYIDVNIRQTYVSLNQTARFAILTGVEDSRIPGVFAIPTAKAVKQAKKEINQKQAKNDKAAIYVTTRSHYWKFHFLHDSFCQKYG